MNDQVQINSITEDFIKSYFNKTLKYELIESIIYFLCTYLLLAAVDYTITRNESMIFLNFIMIIPVLLMTYLRVKIKKMRFFVLEIVGIMTIGSAIIVVFLKHYIWLLFLFAWGIISIKKSTSIQKVSIDKYKLLVIEALLIPQIILSEYIGAKSLQVLIMIVPIVIMLISIGYICSVRNLRLSMDDIKNHSFNKKDSNIFIAGLTTFILIILLCLYYLGAFEIAHNYTKKIADIFANMGSSEFVNNNIKPHSANSNNSLDNLKHITDNGPFNTKSTFFVIVSRVLNLIFNGVIILAALITSYVVINRMLIYFKKLKNMDKVTFVYKDSEKEKNEIKQKLFKLKNNISKAIFNNNNEKIRKLYKNKILKYKKSDITINNYLSTSEIEKEIKNKTSDSIKEITKIYEKARYSNAEITMQDLEIMKNKK